MISLTFTDPAGVQKARIIAETVTRVYFQNGHCFLHPDRQSAALKALWTDYKRADMSTGRGRSASPQAEEARALISRIRTEGTHFLYPDSDVIGEERLTENGCFDHFFALLCLLMTAVCPEAEFEGLFRVHTPETREKRILCHAVREGSRLTFEQMEGDPVYDTRILSWMLRGDQIRKESRRFPFIRVSLITEDRERVRQDERLAEWIRTVNDVKTEMVSAELFFHHGTPPGVMILGATRALCEKTCAGLLTLSAESGYGTDCFSILTAGEYRGEEISISESVTVIGENAFRDQTGLKSIRISGSVTEISQEAFRGCSSLMQVLIPDSVRELGSYAFMSCTGLKRAVLPGKLRQLPSGLFYGCKGLEDVTIPGRVTEIGRCAFAGCENLRSLTLPDGLRKIGPEAFAGCNSLEQLQIPPSVTEIAPTAFRDCPNPQY